MHSGESMQTLTSPVKSFGEHNNVIFYPFHEINVAEHVLVVKTYRIHRGSNQTPELLVPIRQGYSFFEVLSSSVF